jgi:ATP-binding cassette, subfamily B (MDR/TAP), member 1
MTIIFGQFTKKFTNFTSGNGAVSDFTDAVNTLVLYFVYLFVARFVITYIANICVGTAAIRTTSALRYAFLESTLRLEIWHFDMEDNGSISSQVTTNGNRINQGIAEKLAFLFQGLSLFFSGFIIALAVQWKLALITMSIIPAIFVTTGGVIAIDAVVEAKITKIYSQASVIAQEAISSIKTVHAFWAQDKIVKNYEDYLMRAWTASKKKSPIFGILFSTEWFCVLSGTALAFWQGFRMYANGEIDNVGTVINVVLAVMISSTAMQTIAPQIQALTAASSAATELFSIIDKGSKLDPLSTEGKKPDTCKGDIKIQGLNFAYPSRPTAQVLHDLELSIPAGKTTALVGASGCGKSTLVGLLERWYEPASGDILLDGVRLSDYNTKWLRSNVRLVQQEPVLFRGTIFENVVQGLVGDQINLSADEKRALVEEACKSANAHDFISELPEGYQTEVGERASMLSGGQRQRVAIARSIISDPKILLLDEATSALDPRAEGIVQDALNRVSKNKTTLIIAHKLATVRAADNIVVMSNGRVLEQGTHRELIDLDRSYASLVRAQDLGSTGGDADFSKEEADLELSRTETLTRTKTETVETKIEKEIDKLTSGTLGYGLIRSVGIMLLEQKDLYWRFAISGFACLIGGGTYPAQALLEAQLITVFTLPIDEARPRANFFALMFFVVAIANFLAYFVIGWFCNDVSRPIFVPAGFFTDFTQIAQIVTYRYRSEMLSRIMYLDQDFFDRPENSSGALASKLTSVPNALLELMAANLLLIFIVVVNVVSSSAVAIAFGWKLGLVVVLGGLPLMLGSGYVKIRMDQKLENQAGERWADSAALATEYVTSIRTVASLTMEPMILAEYKRQLDLIVKTAVRASVITYVPYALSQSLDFLVMALGFWYGSRLLASGEYTVNQFFVVFIAVIFGGQAAGQFFGYSTSITKARPAANYVLWLRTLQATIREDPSNKSTGPSGDGAIALDDVEFRYKQRHASRVLRGISMDIPAGSYAACVGPSGCGKTTVISLLERFYDPISGRITLNGDDIINMSPRLYRDHMSLVQQEPTLYQGSVRENISLGLRHEPSEEEILAACKQANAYDFVTSLPAGLNTPCGGKGLQFSGGQRQRIAIARALIRKPRLLLLDEATSALDTQSERIVQKTLDEAASTRTTVAVAHRLSTIRHADVIFVFANGKIAERGTHEELQRMRGRYYEMCVAQSLDRA